MEKTISTGLKVWLWIVLVLNALGLVENLLSFGSAGVLSILINIVLGAAMIYACVALLFQYKKLGFQLILIVSAVKAVVAVINVIYIAVTLGAMFSGAGGLATLLAGVGGTILAVLLAAVVPLITWLLIKNQMDVFE